MRRDIDLKEIQAIEFETLCRFDDFSKKYDIHYYLCCATLLGAVRHGGFVPWDDDVDVMMARPEFERLAALLRETGELPYSYGGHGLGFYPFIKILSDRGFFKVPNLKEDRTPLWVDVLPVDGLAEDTEQRNKQYKIERSLSNMIRAAHTRLGKGRTRSSAIAKTVAHPFAKLVGDRRLIGAMNSYAKRIPFEGAKYVGGIVWGGCPTMPKELFMDRGSVLFEGRAFPAPADQDYYLKNLYGAHYIELPPKRSQVKRFPHYVEAWVEE